VGSVPESEGVVSHPAFSPIAISAYFRKDKIFLGWGRKPSGERARKLSELLGGEVLFVEEGSICSFRFGISKYILIFFSSRKELQEFIYPKQIGKY